MPGETTLVLKQEGSAVNGKMVIVNPQSKKVLTLEVTGQLVNSKLVLTGSGGNNMAIAFDGTATASAINGVATLKAHSMLGSIDIPLRVSLASSNASSASL